MPFGCTSYALSVRPMAFPPENVHSPMDRDVRTHDLQMFSKNISLPSPFQSTAAKPSTSDALTIETSAPKKPLEATIHAPLSFLSVSLSFSLPILSQLGVTSAFWLPSLWNPSSTLLCTTSWGIYLCWTSDASVSLFPQCWCVSWLTSAEFPTLPAYHSSFFSTSWQVWTVIS